MHEHPNEYIKPELMACCGAREISDGNVVLVGTGFPTMSANIAKHTNASYTPDSCIRVAYGAFVCFAILADMVGNPVPTRTTFPSDISLAPQHAINSGLI